MTYPAFTNSKPVASDNGNTTITYIRDNLMALRDSVVAGVMPGWDFTVIVGGGSNEEPARLEWFNSGTERIKVAYTWGTTGGEDGNPTVLAVSYTSNDTASPIVYDAIGTFTISYNADGTVASGAWT